MVDNWADVNGLPDPKYLPAVSKALTQQRKSNPTRDCVVVVPHRVTTQSRRPVGMASNAKGYMVQGSQGEECWFPFERFLPTLGSTVRSFLPFRMNEYLLTMRS